VKSFRITARGYQPLRSLSQIFSYAIVAWSLGFSGRYRMLQPWPSEMSEQLEEFGSIACRVYSPKRDGRNTRSPMAESTSAQSFGADEPNLRARFATLEEVCS